MITFLGKDKDKTVQVKVGRLDINGTINILCCKTYLLPHIQQLTTKPFTVLFTTHC